jgi:hypothetical protein
MNKTIKFISAATLLVAASGAFASEGDANADNAWINQAVASQTATPVVSASAPAPVAAAGSVRASNTQTVTP